MFMLLRVKSHHRPPSEGVKFAYSHLTAAQCSGGGLDEYQPLGGRLRFACGSGGTLAKTGKRGGKHRMADQSLSPAGRSMPAARVYSQQANPAFEAELAARTASREAAFLVPYLHSGMQLLDVGCGPGSITLGLAEIVAPGWAVGIDLQSAQIEQA